jgi:hypothetical protein
MSTAHNLYQEKIINLETNEIAWRDYSAEEIAEVETAQAVALAKTEEQSEQTAAKEALLDKLGITADEAKLLLS